MSLKYPFLDLAAINRPYIPRLKEIAARVIDSGRYVGGPEIEAFEHKLARITGTDYAVGVSNGLDALRLILRAWIEMGRLAPGDEVLVPANTYVASFLAISDAGLVPVGVDMDPLTLNMDTRLLGGYVTERTRAVMTVHLYGRTCWDEALVETARQFNLLVIEDNAQAIGAMSTTPGMDGKSHCTGALGHAAAFSFYPTKNIGALGDAGAVTTSDKELADTVRALANYGSDRRYHNIYLGYNCRLDPLQAAFLSMKLDDLNNVSRERRIRAEIYNTMIESPTVGKPEMPDDCRESVWHQYVLRPLSRDQFRNYMAEHGIGTDVHYAVPPHKQPCYAELQQPECFYTDKEAEHVVSIPISQATSIDDIKIIAEIVNNYPY